MENYSSVRPFPNPLNSVYFRFDWLCNMHFSSLDYEARFYLKSLMVALKETF